MGRLRALSILQGREVVRALGRLPELVERVLAKAPEVERIAERMMRAQNVLYLGRGYNFPVALEGALKLKEISYIHAEGYPAAEMKHGPIALIDDLMPVVFIAPKDAVYQKVVSNVEEVKTTFWYTASFGAIDRKSTRLNSSHQIISYAVFCLKKKK